MGNDFLSFLGPFDPIPLVNNLTGTTAQKNADDAQVRANQQIALQNQYGQQAAGIYAGLNTQGQGQVKTYQNSFASLLQQYAGNAGVGSALPGGTGAQGGAQQRVPGSPAASTDPYGLDVHQQERLNQTIGHLAQAKQGAIADVTAKLASQGITGRPAALAAEQINEHFGAMQAEEETKFYEQIKQDKQQALQTLMATLSDYGKSGISQEEAAGSGYLGLAGGAQAAAQAQQSNSLNQQQLANDQIAGLLNLAGYAAGGGFGGGVKPKQEVNISGSSFGGGGTL